LNGTAIIPDRSHGDLAGATSLKDAYRAFLHLPYQKSACDYDMDFNWRDMFFLLDRHGRFR